MNLIRIPTAIVAISSLSIGLQICPALAQIVPDATLPNNSIVVPNDRIFTINGGTSARANLFHSFSEFSIPTGMEAFFNNSVSVDNIITRVTGESISNIDGLIRANGTANIFLLNPNGIIFGANARLDIGGSFVGSTANRILFADGSTLGTIAAASDEMPLLSVSVPVGLQLNGTGDITVMGNGHQLQGGGRGPLLPAENVTGLSVDRGRSIALVGGNIRFQGGTIVASSGQINIAAIRQGTIDLEFNNDRNLDFGDIELSERSALDASGNGGGSIRLQGRSISLLDGSTVLIQNLGIADSGSLEVFASNRLELIGIDPSLGFRSTLNNTTVAPGHGGNIFIFAPQLRVETGGRIAASTFGPGDGGNVSIQADTADILGIAFSNPRINSGVGVFTFGEGNAGEITLSARQVRIEGGGAFGSTAAGTGSAGDVTVNASESVELAGLAGNGFAPSIIGGTTFSSGDAGNVIVNTQRVSLRGGARIDSSTLASGRAGSVTVRASESIEVSDRVPGVINPSLISSSGNIVDPISQQLLGLPEVPSGDSGNVIVETSVLRLTNEGGVTVRNDGFGDAGSLQIVAESIFLDNGGAIAASTAFGEGGNILLEVDNSLQLRHQSQISARVEGTGNGGNLTLNTGTLVALENSDIVANAVNGRGGNIEIEARGIFGTQLRPQLTPDSDITASSQFGVDGIVQINNPEIDSTSGIVELPENTIESRDRIVSGCSGAGENRFSVIGRGGLPETPEETLRGMTVWEDLRSTLPSSLLMSDAQEPVNHWQISPNSLAEATGWHRDDRGQIKLIARSSSANWQQNSVPCQQVDR